ncbi:MFS transporter [Dyella telluris]|uniref:MFS transporter n=1 Tax=Dyella telluris TaxID=2763498 RepID=A0A7G8Q9Q0_9GAMM|nr:MFS transporter [Dyella telluris]QNK03508.1 MFS transporter [Dyella telluris]
MASYGSCLMQDVGETLNFQRMEAASAFYLFLGTTFTAAGYGATFLFSLYFRLHGAGDLDTSHALLAALLGTFVGVPVVGWWSGRIDAPRLVAAAAFIMASGYAIFSVTPIDMFPSTRFGGFLIGLGWGMFYVGAPIALSERVQDVDRGAWFTKFSAFQMAGICGGPAVLGALVDSGVVDTNVAFVGVIVAVLIASVFFCLFSARNPIPRDQPRTSRWVREIAYLRTSEAIRPIVMCGLGGCVFSGIMAFQVAMTSGTEARPSLFFLIFAATAILARITLVVPLTRAPQVPIVTALLGIMTTGVLFLFGVPYSAAFHVLAAILTGFGYGLAYPVIQTWAVNKSEPRHRHAALCWFVLAYFVGIFGFPVIGGWILSRFGLTSLLLSIAIIAATECAVSASALGPGAASDKLAGRRTEG